MTGRIFHSIFGCDICRSLNFMLPCPCTSRVRSWYLRKYGLLSNPTISLIAAPIPRVLPIRQALRRTDPSNPPIFKTRAYVDPCSPSSSHAGLLKIISLILISSVSRDLRCAKRHFPKTHNEDIRTMIGTGVIIRQPDRLSRRPYL